jgi:Lon-like protease
MSLPPDSFHPNHGNDQAGSWAAAPVPPARGRGRLWLAGVPILLLAALAYLVNLPYFVLSPGPARDVEPLIQVRATASYPSRGHFLLTAVNLTHANAFGLLAAWLDSTSSVVPERDILAPGESQEQEVQVARSQMDTSKIDAAVVALRAFAGYPRRHRPGALVERVFPGTPADGKLFAGDVIVAVDGRRVQGPGDIGVAVRAAGAGTPLALTVHGRPGGTVDVSVVPTRVRGVDHPVIGVSSVANFPFPLTIQSGDIGGPSAGLMWTLGLIDLLTPGDLTRGRTIAGTGEIEPDGTVLPIGGVQEKVAAAERAGASVFLAPTENAADARSVAGRMVVVSVATYRDALRYLQSGR